jgi:hypothetical protein
VQGLVEAAPGPAAHPRLHRAGLRVAQEQQVARAAQLPCLDHLAVGQLHARPARQVQPGFDDAAVAQDDSEARVGAEQAALADRDDRRAAAGQRALDGRAAADVAAVADDDARGDPALDHGRAERACVEVHEALVHHRGAFGEMGAQADTIAVGDPHAGRHDVVGHPRELVHRVDRERHAGAAEAQPHFVDLGGMHGAVTAPRDVRQDAEDPVEVEAVRPDQPVREQVQPQVGVRSVARRRVEILDDADHRLRADGAALVARGSVHELGRRLVRRVRTEARRGIPGVQHGVAGDRRQAGAPGASCLAHRARR